MPTLAVFRINCLFMVCSCSFFVLFEPTADNGSCKCFDTVASDTTQQSATVVKLEVTGLSVGVWFFVRLSQKVGGVEKLSIANQIQRRKTT